MPIPTIWLPIADLPRVPVGHHNGVGAEFVLRGMCDNRPNRGYWHVIGYKDDQGQIRVHGTVRHQIWGGFPPIEYAIIPE